MPGKAAIGSTDSDHLPTLLHIKNLLTAVTKAQAKGCNGTLPGSHPLVMFPTWTWSRKTGDVWLGVLLLVHSNTSQGDIMESQNAESSPGDTQDPGEGRKSRSTVTETLLAALGAGEGTGT